MSSAADNPSSVAGPRHGARSRAARRPHDAQASRRALLAAASALFDERGYDAATIRDIGERAEVDPALIARYFGGKEGLYVATLAQEGGRTLPADPAAELARRGVADADLRAELLFAMALGISLTRASGTLPLLANAPLERLLDVVGPLAAAVADGD